MENDNERIDEIENCNDIIKDAENLCKEENKEKNEKINDHIDRNEERIEEKKNVPNEEIKEKESKNKEEEQKTEKKYSSNNQKRKKEIILLGVLIIFFLIFSVIFAIFNINNERLIKGVYIEKVDISNLTKEEAKKIINNKINSIEEIELSYGDYSSIVKVTDINLKIMSNEAIEKAIKVGRTSNIVIDNYQILKANIFKTKIKLDINIDEAKLNEMINNIQAEIPEAAKEYYYEIDKDNLIITNGIPGIAIDSNKLKEQIIENIKEQFNGNQEKINMQVQQVQPKKIDIEEIYKEIYREAKDAYIVEEPFELHKEENGIDFNISIEEAQKILSEEQSTYIIPLKITEPKTKVKDLGEKLFKQTLSKYTTIYDAGNSSRASNIALAAKTINDTILLPGEVFSYNGKLGNTTKEKGYKLGGAYVGGKVIQAYGGGICQVSTTLYNTVLYANLEIVERYNHSYAVNYVPAGRDATVSYGGKDFKFKNTRDYPIKIQANAKNGVVSISILGIKQEKEYEIELASNVLSTTPCSTTYEPTNLLEEGQQKVLQKGHNGCTSIVYKIVKDGGKIISKTVLSKDTYKPMNKIIQVGTKKKSISNNTEIINEEPINVAEVKEETIQNMNTIQP